MEDTGLEGIGTQLAALLTTYGMRVVGVIVALFVAWFVANAVRRGMLKALSSFDKTLAKFFSNLARYGILVAAVLGCLGVFGVDTTSFAAVIGAVGLAIGLAFQGTLANFSAGVMLLVFRPFKVDDIIEVAGTAGRVVEIELFTTELQTPNKVRVIVPNGSIFGTEIKNYSHHGPRRVDVPVGAEYSADIDETRAVLVAALEGIEGAVEDPPPEVYLSELGGSSVDWELRCWCDPLDYFAVRERMVRAAKYALDEAGIGIPFPQMDVHLDRSDEAA